MLVAQFVDKADVAAAVRLDLNGGPLKVKGAEFPPPRRNRVTSSNPMLPGEQVTADEHGNRVITLALNLSGTPDGDAATVQAIARELERESNWLRWQPGTSAPQWYHTLRSELDFDRWDQPGRRVTVPILAKPYGIGELVTLGGPLNANPYFETDAANWTPDGGTFARSTAQFHQGGASGLLTPDGVSAQAVARAEMVPAAHGIGYIGSVWVRCAVARNVSVTIDWHNPGLFSGSGNTVAVAANTWTLITVTAAAPATTTHARLTVSMDATPPAGHLLHIDEATLSQSFTVNNDPTAPINGMFFDVAHVKGDVQTPLIMRLPATITGVGTDLAARYTHIAVRRRGDPANTPFHLPAESMTDGVGTLTPQPNDTDMIGAGNNYMRASFAANAAPTELIRTYLHPATPSPDNRGLYRVLMRCRHSVAGDVISAFLRWGGAAATTIRPHVTNPTVTLPLSTALRYVDLCPNNPQTSLVALPYGPDPRTNPAGAEHPVRGGMFTVAAGRTSGAGTTTADFDCLLFLPADDRLAVIRWNADDYGPGPSFTRPTYVYLDGNTDSIYWADGDGNLMPRPPAELSGGLPLLTPGTQVNRVYFVINGDGTELADPKTRTTDVVCSYYPRYLTPPPLET